MISMDKKFCVDCEHCDELMFFRRPDMDPSRNKWQYRCSNSKVAYVDLVTGKTARPPCKDARNIGGACGMHACHYEPKTVKNLLDINQVTTQELEPRRRRDGD